MLAGRAELRTHGRAGPPRRAMVARGRRCRPQRGRELSNGASAAHRACRRSRRVAPSPSPARVAVGVPGIPVKTRGTRGAATRRCGSRKLAIRAVAASRRGHRSIVEVQAGTARKAKRRGSFAIQPIVAGRTLRHTRFGAEASSRAREAVGGTRRESAIAVPARGAGVAVALELRALRARVLTPGTRDAGGAGICGGHAAPPSRLAGNAVCVGHPAVHSCGALEAGPCPKLRHSAEGARRADSGGLSRCICVCPRGTRALKVGAQNAVCSVGAGHARSGPTSSRSCVNCSIHAGHTGGV